MSHITLIAPGKMKGHDLEPMFRTYQDRLQWKVSIHELSCKSASQEHAAILYKIPKDVPLIVLDETGKTLSSPDFAKIFERHHLNGQNHICCVIGGAYGLNDQIREKASHLISFGKQTWPHMMVRVMLMEQLYRAQQILSGHPYHKP